MSTLKSTFVQKALAQYMQDTIDTIQTVAARAGVGVTNQAINSLAYTAVMNGAEGGIANLSFDQALRFVDMGVGRGHPLGGLKSTRISLLSQKKSGMIKVKDNTRKPKKIYSKIAYGKLTWLQNKLLYGYTEEVVAALKKELENGNHLTEAAL